jgi:hypothetical protein
MDKTLMKAVVPNDNALALRQMVIDESERRKILMEYIAGHMKEGTDYGSIEIRGKLSKPSLWKSGAEKFGSLMKLRPDFVRDTETWEMTGSKAGVFCYRCHLYNFDDKVVGVGLGACTLEEKGNYNNAIKMAKKRAFVDAILTTGALSDFFTADLEDMDTKEEYPMSEKQLNYILSLGVGKGKTLAQIDVFTMKAYGKKVQDISGNQASAVIVRLLRNESDTQDGSEVLSDSDMEDISKAI